MDRKIIRNIPPKIYQKSITDGIELILNNNSFQFDNKNYIQTLITAMKTKMAPTNATLTLAYVEENSYEIIGKKKDNNDIKSEFLDYGKDI